LEGPSTLISQHVCSLPDCLHQTLATAGRQELPAPAETPAAHLLVPRLRANPPAACLCVDLPPSTPSIHVVMEGQANTVKASLDPRVKANLVLGAESFAISSESGILSEQLATMKEKSMVILKEYITKHNAPNDVPDESLEGESDDEAEAIVKNPPKKSKKQK
ncbi:unnamed protein product, partial [Urochloa humidicola]